MVRARLQGINTVKKRLADGSVRLYYYHRATGRPLTGKPGSPAFLSDYAAAEKSMRDRLAGTFNGLIRDYTLSPEFEKLAESTQKEYRRMLIKAESRFGNMPIAALEDPRVRQDFMAWRAEVARSSGDREADNRLSVTSAMLTWARDNGQVTQNHIAGFRRLYHSDRSEIIWFPEHVEAFMKVAPIELQRALILAIHTGQRQGDLLRLSWNNYDGQNISLRQRKTGARIETPCTAALKAMLDSIPRETAVILATKTKISWKSRHFRAEWQKASIAAGLDRVTLPGFEGPQKLHFNDLRGTAVTMLAEAGCTVPHIASITGHSLKTVTSILERYLARTRVLASEAIVLFENAKATRFANRLQTRTPTLKKGDAK